MAKFLALLLSLIIGLFSFYNLSIGAFNNFFQNELHYFFLGGMVFSMAILLRFEKKFEFYSTFEHELTHNLWAIFFFKKPTGFRVNEDGTGLFQWIGAGKFSKVFILLAPYFFPTACFLWLPFYEICKEEYYWLYFMLMGIFFGYHLISTYQEIGIHQTDITENGIVYSFIVITCLFVFFHGVVLSLVSEGYEGVYNFVIGTNMQLVKNLLWA